VLALAILPLMLWVAPVRPRAVLVIWITAIAVGVVLLFAGYFFEPALFEQGDAACALDQLRAGLHLACRFLPQRLANALRGSPPLGARLAGRTNRAHGMEAQPLFRQHCAAAIAALLLILALALQFPRTRLQLTMLVFFFVFVSGVCADLIETPQRQFVRAGLIGCWAHRGSGTCTSLWRVEFR